MHTPPSNQLNNLNSRSNPSSVPRKSGSLELSIGYHNLFPFVFFRENIAARAGVIAGPSATGAFSPLPTPKAGGSARGQSLRIDIAMDERNSKVRGRLAVNRISTPLSDRTSSRPDWHAVKCKYARILEICRPIPGKVPWHRARCPSAALRYERARPRGVSSPRRATIPSPSSRPCRAK